MNAQNDAEFMRRCIELARRGIGRVEPNPAVGCVIARDGVVIAEGRHQEFGEAHAEVNALREAGATADGATLYVSLEPCSTVGKTPPCADAILKAGIKEVIFGASDGAQQGEKVLRRAGIFVRGGVLAEECRQVNPYFFRIPRGVRPFVMAKWAMTIDGRTRTPAGKSRWISCEESRNLSNRWRGAVDAICVGVGTMLTDDPKLTCRAGLRSPKRVVLDSTARTPLASQLARTARETPVIIVTTEDAPSDQVRALDKAGCAIVCAKPSPAGIDLADALRLLHAKHDINTLMLEGGGRVHTSAAQAHLIDETRIFIAPIAGDDPAVLPEAWAMDAITTMMQSTDTIYHRSGSDMLLIRRSSDITGRDR